MTPLAQEPCCQRASCPTSLRARALRKPLTQCRPEGPAEYAGCGLPELCCQGLPCCAVLRQAAQGRCCQVRMCWGGRAGSSCGEAICGLPRILPRRHSRWALVTGCCTAEVALVHPPARPSVTCHALRCCPACHSGKLPPPEESQYYFDAISTQPSARSACSLPPLSPLGSHELPASIVACATPSMAQQGSRELPDGGSSEAGKLPWPQPAACASPSSTPSLRKHS